MSKRNATRSGNPAVPVPPKMSLVTGAPSLVTDKMHEHPADGHGHHWLMLTIHQVPDPGQVDFYLSESTLVEARMPQCGSCGVAWSPAAAERYCPGVAQPTSETAATDA